MSETENPLDARRLPFSLILAGIIVFASFAFTSSGAPASIIGCNNPSSLEQCGTNQTCIITAPSTTCVVTITFSPPFVALPKYEAAQWVGFNGAQNHPEKNVPAFSATFEADNGEIWTNMPAATTELYGDTNHETSFDSGFVLSLANEAQFYMSCLTNSNSATATLRPQFFNIGTGTWQELAQSTGGLDINFGGAFCTPGGGGDSNLESGFSALNPTALTQQTEFRVVGFNGGGVGDVPKFNNIKLLFFTVIKLTPSICIPQQLLVCPASNGPANGKTTIILTATINYPPVSGFEVDMNWQASE